MNETALLARQMAVVPECTVLTDHQQRMEKILDREVVKRKSDDKWKDKVELFYKFGFRVIVRPEFALRFRYGASILGNCVGQRPEPRKPDPGDLDGKVLRGLIMGRWETATISGGMVIPMRQTPSYDYPSSLKNIFHYAGDIPDFVLDKIEFIKKNCELPIISVHSQEELPITVEEVPPRIEPVAIWWADNPVIGKQKIWTSSVDTIGAVIAIWDRDREIEILEG